MTTPPLEQPNRTIGSRNDHRALADVYGRVFEAALNASQSHDNCIKLAAGAVREFAALLRETA